MERRRTFPEGKVRRDEPDGKMSNEIDWVFMILIGELCSILTIMICMFVWDAKSEQLVGLNDANNQTPKD